MYRPAPDLLVSDAERDEVASFLKRHFADGRLTQHEFAARVDATYRSRWMSQLRALTADLPAIALSPARPARPARRRGPGIGAIAIVLFAAAALLGIELLPQAAALVFFLVILPLVAALVVAAVPIVAIVAGVVWLTKTLTGQRRPLR